MLQSWGHCIQQQALFRFILDIESILGKQLYKNKFKKKIITPLVLFTFKLMNKEILT